MPGTESIFAVGDKDMNHRGSRLSQSIGPGWKNRHDLKAEYSGESQVCVTKDCQHVEQMQSPPAEQTAEPWRLTSKVSGCRER